MNNVVKIIADYLGNDMNYLEETNKENIKKLKGSKTTACWNQGEIGKTGYYKLAQFSPRVFGEKPTVIFCKSKLIK